MHFRERPGRIKPIDGWRALAALGVLWTHTWGITNFHSFKIGNVNVFKSINIIGNGVHLFFIISGFCMYLILRKQRHSNFKIFIEFIKKRWQRIAPAFYFACIVICIFNYINDGQGFFPPLIYNFIFLQNHLPHSVISSPFWSLAVEWHFYMLLPLLFIVMSRTGFLTGVFLICLLSLIINVLHYNNILLAGEGWWYYLPGNLIHFMWGILLAYIITNNKRLPSWLTSGLCFIVAIGIANFGKLLFSQFGLDLAGNHKWIFLSFGPAIMTLGFCWLIYISLNNNLIGGIIGNKYLAALGKISYSFYLWHSFILELIYRCTKDYLHFGGFDPILLYIFTLLILLPVSYLSYAIFESFYFTKRSETKVLTPIVNSIA